MDKKEIINKINNELKSYINESSFISTKCRNKLLKIFEEAFDVKLDIRNYQNVDLQINDDFTITYRDDIYKSNFKNISNLIVVLGMFIIMIILIYFGIISFISGNYIDCLWFVLVVLPWLFPKFKSSFLERLAQAKNFIHRLIKRVK